MSSYTVEQLRQAAADHVLTADTLSSVYDGMYSAANSGGFTYTTDAITPQSVLDNIKDTLLTAGFAVTVPQGQTTLQISWQIPN